MGEPARSRPACRQSGPLPLAEFQDPPILDRLHHCPRRRPELLEPLPPGATSQSRAGPGRSRPREVTGSGAPSLWPPRQASGAGRVSRGPLQARPPLGLLQPSERPEQPPINSWPDPSVAGQEVWRSRGWARWAITKIPAACSPSSAAQQLQPFGESVRRPAAALPLCSRGTFRTEAGFPGPRAGLHQQVAVLIGVLDQPEPAAAFSIR